MIRSRAPSWPMKRSRADDLPDGFAELSRRIEAAEDGARRGTGRPARAGSRPRAGRRLHARLPRRSSSPRSATRRCRWRPTSPSPTPCLPHHTGLFRVMAGARRARRRRLRHTAKALASPGRRRAARRVRARRSTATTRSTRRSCSAVRRAGRGAAYVPYRAGVVPWHSAMAATYAHATAPLRRLADRYVIEAALAVATGQPVAGELERVFEQLPPVMAAGRRDAPRRSSARSSTSPRRSCCTAGGRALRRGRHRHRRARRAHPASDPAVIARVDGRGAVPGDRIEVKLTTVDVAQRRTNFERVG